MPGIRVRGRHLGLVALGAACALLLWAPLATARVAPERTVRAVDDDTWNATATAHRGQNGGRFVYTCPSYGASHPIWGTDVYTDDSSVCTAAVHAGLITLAGGGSVTIEIRPGQESYQASTRNGVSSSPWGSWVGSFVIVAATPASPGVGVGGVGWHLSAVVFRPYVGARFAYRCPAEGTLGTVWGTDVYTDDSSVCTAGVHAGRITRAAGGSVTIEVRAGQTSYRGSSRNGVTSRDYGSWHGSFVVVGAGAGAGAPPEGTATGTVLVDGKPFSGGQVPYGSTVDVSRGTLKLDTEAGTLTVRGDGKSVSRFVARRVSAKLVELRLAGGDFGPCAARRASSRSATPRPRVVRALWGKGKGGFRTRGKYASATVRGTAWVTADRCDGTLTTVSQGVVEVRDLTRRRTVRVRAGKSYLAPARR